MTETETQPVKVPKVPSIADMDNVTFLKHMQRRHPNRHMMSEGFDPENFTDSPAVIGPWRAYHDRLHAIALPGEMTHRHAPKKETS